MTTEDRTADRLDPEDDRVEQLAVEIEATRDDLTETVEAIGDKLEPSNLAREAGETVREVTIGKVEQMTTGMQETWRDVRTGDTEGILQTITSNPLPSAMIGLGFAMLFMNRGNGSRYRSSDAWQGRSRFDHGADRGYERPAMGIGSDGGIGSTIGEVRDQAGETLGRATDRAGRTIDRMTSTVGDAAAELPGQFGDMVEERGSQVRRMVDENPLAAGVVALAAGAAIGMLIPTTQVEREAIGEQRDRLIGQAQGAIDETLDAVESSTKQPGGSAAGTGM